MNARRGSRQGLLPRVHGRSHLRSSGVREAFPSNSSGRKRAIIDVLFDNVNVIRAP